jgi:hypothetical protein
MRTARAKPIPAGVCRSRSCALRSLPLTRPLPSLTCNNSRVQCRSCTLKQWNPQGRHATGCAQRLLGLLSAVGLRLQLYLPVIDL